MLDITRAELIELVRRVMAADEDTDTYLQLLDTRTPHPAIADLIFHPPIELRDASAEQIVDAALSYRPIVL
ncbi:hypothetical protein D5S18_19200 [Nocardia panacis]|uniref:E9imm peptide n=1 Tax=Nocardia panacis TaxID=2340916 RepID=A0A3A4KD46_9NOCA|nr:bacteriocin immunity protein [Nocardia panacis]RJO73365.1 hypothetical protein D5S18_19200 [Nocardia panacis]